MPEVEIVRSAKRRSTLSASLVEGRVVVRVPARMSKAELDRMVPGLVRRVMAKQQRSAPSDDELMARAQLLSRRHLDARAVPTSVRWVGNQHRRWGSCTTTTGQIRLSDRLQRMPQYVIDYVLVHELTHLLHPDHGPAFKAMAARYPQGERAEAFLAGVSFASGLPPLPLDDLPDDAPESLPSDPRAAGSAPA